LTRASDEAVAAAAPYSAVFTQPIEIVAAELDVYVALLRRWQDAQNLVSRETLPTLWSRHVADSLQVLKHRRPEDTTFLDLGSGGGLPAIPLAIALNGTAGVSFRLVESNSRKVAFLRTVIRTLSLPATVDATRIEQIDSRETFLPHLITSRALARLPGLCGLAAPFFGPETRAIFHKGREFGEELAETRAEWDFDMLVSNSDTSSDGVLLEIANLRSKPAR
jgi:16S rRNA (guanine527-N7)-methyltransferase